MNKEGNEGRKIMKKEHGKNMFSKMDYNISLSSVT
jgi:hypothetical protein